MHTVNLRFNNVTFSYTPTSENIVSSLNIHFSKEWTGIVGPNGSGKSTIAKLAAGILTPSSGSITGISSAADVVYCEQETGYIPGNADEFILSCEGDAGELRSILNIEYDWPERWNSLSCGERKRFQTGIALWRDSLVLILDEPVNHLDTPSKNMITSALKKYNGTGIIISHDRDILDALCSSCLFVKPGNIILRSGNYSEGLSQEEIEEKSRVRESENAFHEYKRIKRSAASLKQKESGRSGSLSKKNAGRHDHDAKSKIDLARLTGKDKTGARKVKLMERKAEDAGNEAESKYYRKRIVKGFAFRGEKSRRDTLVSLNEGSVHLGPERKLYYPDLVILPSDKIALTGENGSGKTTLLKDINSQLSLDRDKVIYIPQEIDENTWLQTEEDMKKLSGDQLGMLFTVVHRLGSEPERVMFSESASPGEKRKIMLGLGLMKMPALIMMDEPTNHMDLPSIICLEEALNQFEGAVVLVSHDERFIGNITEIEWKIVREKYCSRVVMKNI